MGLRPWAVLAASAVAVAAAVACGLIDDPPSGLENGQGEPLDGAPADGVAPSEAGDTGAGTDATDPTDATDATDATNATDRGVPREGAPPDGPAETTDGGSASTCDGNVASDPANCGQCGRVCAPTAHCTDGGCQVAIVLQSTFLNYLTATEGVVYYDFGDSTGPGWVYSYEVATGVNPRIIGGLNTPGPMAVHGTYVFWSDGQGAVWRANTDGTNLTRLGNAKTDEPCIAVNSTYVYWIDDHNYLERAPLDAGAASGMIWPDSGSPMTSLCVAANDAWVAHPSNAQLAVEDLTTGMTHTISVTNEGVAAPVAMGGPWVYFTTAVGGNDFTLYRVDPSDVATLIGPLAQIGGHVYASALVADGNGVYWSSNTLGGLQGCSTPTCAGGFDVDLTTSAPCSNCSAIALDSRYVYYGGGNSDGIKIFTR
jgi:hypothetical protein